jgi:hypothetical protein
MSMDLDRELVNARQQSAAFDEIERPPPEVENIVSQMQDRPVTFRHMFASLREWAKVVKGAISKSTLPLLEEMFLIKKRLDALEAKPVIRDCGVWISGAYEPGNAVSKGGSLWIAQRQTTDAPGASDAWRLAVKRGRDGRDAKDRQDEPAKGGAA